MDQQMVILLILPLLVSGVTLRVNGDGSTTENNLNLYNDQDKSASDYHYSYGVSDQNTGDHKTHWEKRENGVVSGSYSVLQPDGSTRLVQYTADRTGFHPVVQNLNQPQVQSISGLYQTTPAPYYQNSNSYYTTIKPVYSSGQLYPNTGYNYNGRYYFPGSYDRDYRSRYLNTYGGYDSSYRRSDLGPYNLGWNRQRGSGVPLLHSQYHGYDNLYH